MGVEIFANKRAYIFTNLQILRFCERMGGGFVQKSHLTTN